MRTLHMTSVCLVVGPSKITVLFYNPRSHSYLTSGLMGDVTIGSVNPEPII